jgi:DNA repair protein RadC
VGHEAKDLAESARGKGILALPEEERPRERMIRLGEGALSDAELLALILGRGTREASALDLGRELLARFGGLRAMAGATMEEICGLRGMGRARAAQVKAALEIARRAWAERQKRGTAVRCSEDIYRYVLPDLRDRLRETFLLLLLDGRNRVFRSEVVSEGSLTRSIVHPREVFSPAIRHSAARVAVVHNHPSGDPAPSPEDFEVTRRLKATSELTGIALLDHVIVGDGEYVSFVDRGWL